jgi:N-acetylmuramoyl-L-alanine amidase-like protein/peptidase C39-like protein
MPDSKYVTSEMYVPDAFVFLDAKPAYAIVIHKSASPGIDTAEKLAEYFIQGSDGRHVSSHYTVGKDGHIVQVVREKDGAGANDAQPVEAGRNPLFNADINWNLRTISIEVVDTSVNNTDTLTAPQKASVFNLVKDIATRKAIAVSHIVQHHDLQPISKPNCAGNFPMQELLTFVKGGNTISSINGPLKNKNGEVIDIVPVSQFYPNKTEFACGFFAASQIKYGAQPNNDKLEGTATDIETWALQQYTQEYGSNGANMSGGVSIADMHRLLIGALPSQATHYYDLNISASTPQSSDLAQIYGALNSGYPVVCTVSEASIIDKQLGVNPYWWGASGNHVFIITGYNAQGDLLVHDPANVTGALNGANTVRSQPRTYSKDTIDISWASMCHMPWLVSWPSGWNVLTSPPLNQIGESEDLMGDKISTSNQTDKNNLIVEIWNTSGKIVGAANIPSRNSKSFEVWYADTLAGIIRGLPLENEVDSKDETGEAVTKMGFTGGILVINKKDGTHRWL